MIDIGTYNYEEDIDLPKLSDYDEIRTFQDYEFTQCVVYELAIRNPRYKEEVYYVMEFYKQFKKEIDIAIIYFSKPIKGFISPDPKLHTRHPSRIKFSELKKLISNIEVIPFNLEKNTLEYRDPNIFEEKFYELLDFIMENKPSQSINLPPFMLNDKPIDIVDIYEGDGFVVETKIQSKGTIDFELPKDKPYEALHSIMSSTTDKDFYDFVKKDNNVITPIKVAERLRRDDILISHVQVYEKFKRPKLKLNSSTSKNIIVEIDLSRPKKEIDAYIEHLQNSLINNSDIVTPMELLASLFEPEDETLSTNEKNNADSQVDKFAEKLFIYDFIEEVMRKSQEHNDYIKEQFEYECEDIRSMNKYTRDMTKVTKEAEKEYAENKVKSSAKAYHEDEKLRKYLKISKKSTIKNSHKAIIKLMQGERYKDLNSTIE